MKILASWLFMMTVALVAWGDTSIYWLNPTHDFGAFKEDSGVVTCVFKGVNINKEPITIVSARATCGCTTPRYSYNAFAPGDTIEMRVSYDPSGRPGRFVKKVYVRNSHDENQAELAIKGVVIGNEATLKSRYRAEYGKLRMQNSFIDFGDMEKNKDKGIYVTAYNQTVDTIEPSLSNLPSYIQTSIIPNKIPPGEQATIAVHLLGRECDKWGPINEMIKLKPDNGEQAFEIPLIANIIPNFSRMTPGERMKAPKVVFESDRVNVGIVSRNGGKVSVEATLKNEGENVLEIYRVYTISEGVDVKVEKDKIKGGKSTKVMITIDPALYKGEVVNGEVIFVVNDPNNPQSRLRFVGEME